MAVNRNKRDSTRRSVCFEVIHNDPRTNKPATDYAKDLSAGGLFIRTKRIRPLGSTLQVQFSPTRNPRDPDHSIRARCEVVRLTEDGVGTRFVELDAEAKKRLERLLVDLEQRA